MIVGHVCCRRDYTLEKLGSRYPVFRSRPGARCEWIEVLPRKLMSYFNARSYAAGSQSKIAVEATGAGFESMVEAIPEDKVGV